MEHKHENRVQDDVAYGSDEHGVHACLGISLGIDEGVESQSQLYENGSQGINLHVSPPILYGIAAGSEHQQDAAAEDEEESSQDNGHGYKSSGTVAQDVFCFFLSALAQHNGCPGSAAHAYQGSKGGNRHDNREGDAHACKRMGAFAGQMADIHTVHHVIQHVDDLGCNGRQSQLKKKFSHASRAQVHLFCFFVLLHIIHNPFVFQK